MRALLFLSVPGLLATIAGPKAGDLPCSAAMGRVVRKDAQKLVKAGRFQDAIKMYESFTERCARPRTRKTAPEMRITSGC